MESMVKCLFKYLFVFFSLTFLLMLLSCSKEILSSKEIYFLGDSHVEYWDVQSYFPMARTYNVGVAGEGVESLTHYAHSLKNKVAVVIVGTNDINKYMEDGSELEFSESYICIIRKLDAMMTVVVSVFPQTNVSSPELVNGRINTVNHEIAGLCSDYGINYVDMTDLFLKDNQFNPRYSDDGRHPNQLGYEQLALRISKVLH